MRSGYTDDIDNWQLIKWRGMVASAIRGKRGQKLLRDLRDSLNAMPEKALIANEFALEDGSVCALGCVYKARGLPGAENVDSEEHDFLADKLDVASCLIQEIEYENDEGYYGSWREVETPEKRWERIMKWCNKHIQPESP